MQKTTRPLVIGNWKMHPQTEKQAIKLANEIKSGLSKKRGAEVVLAPPFIYLSAVEKVRSGGKTFATGAQDAYWERIGAKTGEVSVAMLKELGISYIIIGHSERRAMGETDEMVNKKLHSVLREGIIPVVCIGEKKRDQWGRYLGEVEKQIRKACAGVSKAKLERLVVAYEPIWAIGTGDTATSADVHEMRIFIQKILTDLYGRAAAHKVRILYGGSVNAKNAGELMEEGMADGFLVGGASLRADEFVRLVRETS